MEEMLEKHILIELTSNNVWLRCRACWLYGIYSEMAFQDNKHVQAIV